MTSLRYYKSPRITKLDGRFKGYNRGFRFKVSFNTQGNYDPYARALKWCQNTYGPEYEWTDKVAWSSKRWNSNWRAETAKNKWWREIYLCEEADVTMMLLVVGG